MSVKMGEGGGELEDELIDLNKEPVERKRKQVEKNNNSADKGDEGSDGLSINGRVLRSRTVAMSDGEKQVIEMEIVNVEDKNESEVPVVESENAGEVPVLQKNKGKRGRPRKTESKSEISSPSPQKKRKRGRPPKNRGKCEITSLCCSEEDDKITESKKVNESSNGAARGRGRPPKNRGKCEISFLRCNEEDDKTTESKKLVESSNGTGRGRGRPPKNRGKCEITSLCCNEEDDKMTELKKVDESSNGVGRGRGRPPKIRGKCDITSLCCSEEDDKTIESKVDESSNGARRGRGRPPKNRGKCDITSFRCSGEDDKTTELKKVDESSNGVGRGRGRPKRKGKRGRPRKTENENMGLAVKKKIVKRNSDHKKYGNGVPVKRLKVGANDIRSIIMRQRKQTVKFAEGSEMDLEEQKHLARDQIVSKVRSNDLGNAVMRQKKVTVEGDEGKQLGLREQKQLVRDQIVAMLDKAGWSVEYRQRQSKDYQDAVYVDREGRAYWSVTLAYFKLKERIDNGMADETDVLAFSSIPEETLSILFRITQKGKKAGKSKNSAGRTIKTKTKKESSKSKSSDGSIKSRQNRGSQRTLLVRKHRDGSDSGDDELYGGNRNLLSWMINLGTIPLGGKVKYKRGRGRRILLEGKIMKEGICCDCCNITHGIREFESHAKTAPGKPYEDIYLDSGISLFQCLVDSWKKHVKNDNFGFVHVDVEGDDPNDDTCNVCGDGGDLICCDSCPSTFHHGCLCIKVPSGDWHCVYCSCKFCGMACESTSNSDDDSDSPLELVICRLCEQKFHVHCVEETIAEDVDHGNRSFCGKECFEIFEKLQVLLGVKHELDEGFFYTILHHVVTNDASLGDSSKVEINAKLAVGFSVMDECFEPIIDERSGSNMIQNVVYNCGSNIRRLNYEGFYTIILEKGDEAVAAASIRIHGSQLAEMPFIGTRFVYRRQGMCSRLLASIETVLRSLGVGKLVIPAISELSETWTKVFGFGPLEESTRQEMKYMSMIVFPGVDMLLKPLLGNLCTKSQIDSAECTDGSRPEHQNLQENAKSATESTKLETHHQNFQDQIGEIGAIPEPNHGISSDIEIHSNDKVVTECTDGSRPEHQNLQENAKSATETIKLETHHQNFQDQIGEIGAIPEPNFGISSDIEIHSNDKVVTECTDGSRPEHQNLQENAKSATESTKLETHHQNFQDQIGEIGAIPEPNLGISSDIEIHSNDKVAVVESGDIMPVDLSDKGDINIGAVSDGVYTSKDDGVSLKTDITIDCNVEAEQSADETNACADGLR